MDFNLKQWRDHESEEENETSAKHPKLNPLPLFVPDPHLSDNNTSATNFTKMGSYFSLAQWHELELQALIFRHIMAGAVVPPDLLHLVNKSVINSPYNYLCNQYYPHYQPSYESLFISVVQSGYWGKERWIRSRGGAGGPTARSGGAPETWWRGRSTVRGTCTVEGTVQESLWKRPHPVETPRRLVVAPPSLSLVSPGLRLLIWIFHLNRRPLETINETKCTFESHNDGHGTDSGGQTLRRFFDDWPRSDDATTNLSISTPGSDFSLKLGSGDGDGDGSKSGGERDRVQLNWGMTWENNQVAPMGGPLAEVLRSSVSSSSPTSVLHRLARSSASENSYVSS